MGPWVLKFMIVFSVILLQYVKTDVSSGNGGSLQDTDRIDVNSRHKRSYGRSKFRTGKRRRYDPLGNQQKTRNPLENRLPVEPWYYNTELSGRPLASSNQERRDINKQHYNRESELQDNNQQQYPLQPEPQENNQQQYPQQPEPQDNRKQFSRESVPPDNNQQQHPRQSELQDDRKQHTRESEPPDNRKQHNNRESESLGAIGDPCITKPCANRGTCKWTPGKTPDFKCKCALGYKGKVCQDSVPECESQPCNDKGSCVSTPKGFICLCTDDFHGTYCEDKTMKNKTVLIITPEEFYEAEIGLGIFGGLVVVIIVILVIHFIRVNKRREDMVVQYKRLLLEEETPPPLPPGMLEVSNLLCYEVFCFACPKWSESLTKYASKEGLQKASSKMEEEPLMSRQRFPSIKKSLDSVWRGSYEEQKPKYRTSRDKPQSLVYPKQYSATKPKSFASLPMQMSHLDQQYSWLPKKYDRSAVIVQQPEEIVNIEQVPSQESLLSRQSSRVLPRIQSRMSPRSPARSNKSFKKRSSLERPWSYDIDPHLIQSRRKALHHHSGQETSDEIADLYDRITDSRHEMRSHHNQHLENVPSEYRPQHYDQSLEQMESEYRRLSRRQSPNRRSSSSSNRHYMQNPPPPPPHISRDSGIDRKYGSSLIRRLSSKFDQGQYIPPAPPIPPPPPFYSDN
ncbi:uncharacterized protein LOC143064105 isoform X5 [Mytilus galloprovincialis]|uniref:uncharacterized protein LOC143064105 isoform X5 n=1 Tax=Mytilus galloprovincialis TaxID=29158 RepID=UPI003F7C7AE3